MSTRALLALFILVGVLPIQCVVAQPQGRAESSPSVLFLRSDTGPPFALSPGPAQQGWVDIGRNGSAEFRLDEFFGLYEPALDFGLELSVTALNGPGMNLSLLLLADLSGDTVPDVSVIFKNLTTVSNLTEHTSVGVQNVTGTLQDVRQGSLRLLVNRTDGQDGQLRLHCGADPNSSMLLVPFTAPIIADAGPDISARVGHDVAFNASRSRTVDPPNTQYTWDFDASDGLQTDATGPAANHSFPAAGNYTVTLTLKMGLNSSNDTLLVNVGQNARPLVDAGSNRTGVRMGAAVSFHGTATDPDGTVVSYNWSFGDGSNASGQNVTHTYSIPGNFTVRLVVRDDDGASANDSLWVRINYPPVITYIPFTVLGSQASFRVNASDPDRDDILYYRWDFGDGSNSTLSSPVHQYKEAGDYLVRCTVSDQSGDNATSTVNVSITNLAPVIVNLGASGTALTGENVEFAPSVYDPEHDILTYQWDFGDGGTSTDPEPVHSYSTAGNYLVTLLVSDGSSTVSSSQLISVTDASATDESSLAVGMACLAAIGIIVVVALVYFLSRSRPQAPSGQYGYPGAYSTTTYPGGPPAAPGPVFGVPGPSRPPPRAPPAAGAPPGTCPRCGSRELTVFGDGHSKCNNCKKIIYTG